MLYVVWWILAYLVGAFPFGLLVAQVFCRLDPRKAGSKNTGATNIARLCGLKYGLLVLALDLLKGFLPVFAGYYLSNSPWFLSLTGLASIVGHMYSVYLYGKGGKGVATTLGVYLALFPLFTCFALLLFALVIWISGYVSVGSIIFVTTVPLLLVFSPKIVYVPLTIVVAMLVIFKHRENIERLIAGTEKSWRKKV